MFRHSTAGVKFAGARRFLGTAPWWMCRPRCDRASDGAWRAATTLNGAEHCAITGRLLTSGPWRALRHHHQLAPIKRQTMHSLPNIIVASQHRVLQLPPLSAAAVNRPFTAALHASCWCGVCNYVTHFGALIAAVGCQPCHKEALSRPLQKQAATGGASLLGPLPPPLALQAPHTLLPPLQQSRGDRRGISTEFEMTGGERRRGGR